MNERSFDRLFCDVHSSKEFDLYYNTSFADDPVFNHVVIEDSILRSLYHSDIEISLIRKINEECTKLKILPSIYLEDFWPKTRQIEMDAIEAGYIIMGFMIVLSKRVNPGLYAKEEFKVLETDQFKVWNQVFINSYSIPPFWEEELAKRELKFAPSVSTRLFIARDANMKAVGCMLTQTTPEDYMGVYCVGTIPQMRRRGIAKALMQKAEDMAESAGCKHITLQTIEADGATPMYLRLGYNVEFRRMVLQRP